MTITSLLIKLSQSFSYQWKGNFLEIQIQLISEFFQITTSASFCQAGSHFSNHSFYMIPRKNRSAGIPALCMCKLVIIVIIIKTYFEDVLCPWEAYLVKITQHFHIHFSEPYPEIHKLIFS